MKVRVCPRPWEYIQIYNSDGDVCTCPWARNNYIGNLVKDNIQDIFSSKRMLSFRRSILDGSYKYCMHDRCPYISNNTLDQRLIEIDSEYTPKYPIEISLSYELACNYVCTSCREKKHIYSEAERHNIDLISEKLYEFIDNVKIISANGRGELFSSPSILRLLRDYNPTFPNEEVMVLLETNGSLFDESHWDRISNLGKYFLKVSITIMSFDEKTYQYLSGTNNPISKLEQNLRFVKELRTAGIINELELATVVQERNFRSLPEFAHRCIEEFSADIVRIRPYFPYGRRGKVFEWFCDIRNPYHPYYDEYLEVMKDPIFKNPKVFMWSGNSLSEIGPCDKYIHDGLVSRIFSSLKRSKLFHKIYIFARDYL